jgi:NAD(P)-dependent dehydrogenase (short-subunit alcohol dehydrogenase family)
MSMKPTPPFPDQNMTEPGLEEKMSPAPRYKASDYRAAGKLKDRIALVTGGDSGIGRSVAFLFAREGADLALVCLEAERPDAEKIQADIEREGRRSIIITGDLKDPEFCQHAIDRTVDEFGRIDILVNNAAYQKHRGNLDELSIEQWINTFTTNIHAYFYLAKFAVPHMPSGSSIINTGSITGLEGARELLDYASTKGAIHAFTKSLAQNLVLKGIRVNCVAPGPVWTPLNPAERGPGEIKDFGADTPLGRPAQPEEIAPAFVFFASNADSGYISGHVLPILGGDTTAG